jgi:hypothetical protein
LEKGLSVSRTEESGYNFTGVFGEIATVGSAAWVEKIETEAKSARVKVLRANMAEKIPAISSLLKQFTTDKCHMHELKHGRARRSARAGNRQKETKKTKSRNPALVIFVPFCKNLSPGFRFSLICNSARNRQPFLEIASALSPT